MLIDPINTKMHLSVRSMHHVILAFEKMYGKKELLKFVEGTGMSLEYLQDQNNWISYDYCCKLLKALVEYSERTWKEKSLKKNKFSLLISIFDVYINYYII